MCAIDYWKSLHRLSVYFKKCPVALIQTIRSMCGIYWFSDTCSTSPLSQVCLSQTGYNNQTDGSCFIACLLVPNPGIVVTDTKEWLFNKIQIKTSIFDASAGQKIVQDEEKKKSADKLWNCQIQRNLTPSFPCLSSHPTVWITSPHIFFTSPHIPILYRSACLSRSHSDCRESSTAFGVYTPNTASLLSCFLVSLFLSPLVFYPSKTYLREWKRPLFPSTAESGPHLPDAPEIQ